MTASAVLLGDIGATNARFALLTMGCLGRSSGSRWRAIHNSLTPSRIFCKISFARGLSKMQGSRLLDRWKGSVAILPTALGRLMVQRCGIGLIFRLSELSTTSKRPRCPCHI